MVSMSWKTKAFLPTVTFIFVLSILIMNLGMAYHICFLGERIPTIWKCTSIGSFRNVRPNMIYKLTERFANYVTILYLFALINILIVIFFSIRTKLDNEII